MGHSECHDKVIEMVKHSAGSYRFEGNSEAIMGQNEK